MKIIIPTSLKDITLKQYQNYQKEIDASVNRADQMEYLNIKKIQIFCGLTQAEVYNIQYSEVYDIAERIELILQEQPNLVQNFELNGIKFGWVTNLDKLSYGELLDLFGNISDWETMVAAMGVLYRPIIKEQSGGLYLVEKYKGDKYHKDLLEMPMDAVIGSMVFFWNLGMDLASCIIKSLETDQELMTQVNFQDNGIGIAQSMNSLVETLQSMKRLHA
jgi:hypothetical protein